jgi:hypothetical protein
LPISVDSILHNTTKPEIYVFSFYS